MTPCLMIVAAITYAWAYHAYVIGNFMSTRSAAIFSTVLFALGALLIWPLVDLSSVLVVALVAPVNMAVTMVATRPQLNATFRKWPIDRLLGGREVFGQTKTIPGLATAAITGVALLGLIKLVGHLTGWSPTDPVSIAILSTPLWYGFAIGLAPMVVDLSKSVVKRRLNIVSGGCHWLDTLDSPVGVILLGVLGLGLTTGQYALVIPALICGHAAVSVVGGHTGLKAVGH